MFDLFSWKKRKFFKEKSLPEIKDMARVLVIDNKRPDLVGDLEKEGWRVKYLDDLDKYNNTDLIDSHVICLDILDVGKKLRCDSGLGLVEGIKEKYPGKKILLYSSVSKHNIFDVALDKVDKRILKDGQPYQFIRGVEELAFQSFDWNSCIKEVYARFKSDFGKEISFEDFNEKMKKCISYSGEIDINKIANYTLAGMQTAKAIKILIQLVTS